MFSQVQRKATKNPYQCPVSRRLHKEALGRVGRRRCFSAVFWGCRCALKQQRKQSKANSSQRLQQLPLLVPQFPWHCRRTPRSKNISDFRGVGRWSILKNGSIPMCARVTENKVSFAKRFREHQGNNNPPQNSAQCLEVFVFR